MSTPSPSLGFWHPVLLSDELGKKPVAVKLCGQRIVLFRDSHGAVSALDDSCPHRGMRLSTGKVKHDCVVCPYHAWTFDGSGKGHAPSMPQASVHVGAYDTLVKAGAIWIRRKGSTAAFPSLFDEGTTPVTAVHMSLRAPLELLVDNFSEVEHWHTVHQYLGYALCDIERIDSKVEADERSVHVVVTGPQKPLPALLTKAIGIHSGDPFVEEWTTWFEPIYTVYRHGWYDPANGQERSLKVNFANFFCPSDESTTEFFVFAFMTPRQRQHPALRHIHRKLMELLVRHEAKLDRTIVEDLAHRGPSLAGMRLDPLDRAIVENRKRIERVYRRGPGAAPVIEEAADVGSAAQDP